MTNKQRLELRLSEQRQRLNELAGLEAPTEEQMTELRQLQKDHATTEEQFRASLKAEPTESRETGTETAEERELRELRGNVSVGRYVSMATSGQALSGAEFEFSQALGCSGNDFPMELLAPVEERAVTDINTVVRPRAWVDRIFAQGQAGYLGLGFQGVPAGTQQVTVTLTGDTPAQTKRETAKAAGGWTISSVSLVPKRMSAHVAFALEDDYRTPGLEESLLRDMRAALAEQLDRAVFLGANVSSDTYSDIVGLFDVTGTTALELNQASKVKFDKTIEVFAGLIDGKGAGELGDLRIVTSIPMLKLWLGTVAQTATGPETMAQVLRANGLSWRSRADIDDGTADGDKLAVVARTGGLTNAGTVAVWNRAQLIRDPYSGAASGQVGLTLSAYWDFQVSRASNFAKLTAAA